MCAQVYKFTKSKTAKNIQRVKKQPIILVQMKRGTLVGEKAATYSFLYWFRPKFIVLNIN